MMVREMASRAKTDLEPAFRLKDPRLQIHIV